MPLVDLLPILVTCRHAVPVKAPRIREVLVAWSASWCPLAESDPPVLSRKVGEVNLQLPYLGTDACAACQTASQMTKSALLLSMRRPDSARQLGF